MLIILVSAVILTLLAAVLARGLHGLALRPPARCAPDSGCVTLERYRVLERLLDPDDFTHLAAQPGYSRALGRKLRRERRRVFCLYLTSLRRDYARLEALARAVAASGEGDLVAEVLRQRWVFERRMLAVRGRLALHALGVDRVDARPLLQCLQGLALQVASPVRASASVAGV